MREWGVNGFPAISGKWFLWGGCGVYVLIDKGEQIDLHMAMKKGHRHKSRLMVQDIIETTGKPLNGIIDSKNKSVANLGLKMGFKDLGLFQCEQAPSKIARIMRYE